MHARRARGADCCLRFVTNAHFHVFLFDLLHKEACIRAAHAARIVAQDLQTTRIFHMFSFDLLHNEACIRAARAARIVARDL